MELSELIRTLRERTGKSLEEIGKATGVAKATVQRWESGEIQDIKRDKIVKLARALDVSPAVIMGWEEPSPALTQEERKRKELIQAIVANLDKMSPEVLQRFLALIESFLTAPKA